MLFVAAQVVVCWFAFPHLAQHVILGVGLFVPLLWDQYVAVLLARRMFCLGILLLLVLVVVVFYMLPD